MRSEHNDSDPTIIRSKKNAKSIFKFHRYLKSNALEALIIIRGSKQIRIQDEGLCSKRQSAFYHTRQLRGSNPSMMFFFLGKAETTFG